MKSLSSCHKSACLFSCSTASPEPSLSLYILFTLTHRASVIREAYKHGASQQGTCFGRTALTICCLVAPCGRGPPDARQELLRPCLPWRRRTAPHPRAAVASRTRRRTGYTTSSCAPALVDPSSVFHRATAALVLRVPRPACLASRLTQRSASRARSHYARATYSTEQLDRWQTDWNTYFVQYGMEIPVYAHKVRSAHKPTPGTQHGGSLLA